MTIQSYHDIISQSQPYIAQVLDFLHHHGLDKSLIPDHICIKSRSADEYDQLRKVIESAESIQFSYQATITGRRIAYCKLTEGIPFGASTINFIELSDYKRSDDYSGFHHVELYPTTGTLKELASILTGKNIPFELKERPHHTSIDITLPTSFIIRLSDEPLIKKISREILED